MSLLSQIFSNNSPYDKQYFQNLSCNPYINSLDIDIFKNELENIYRVNLKNDVSRQLLIALRNIIIVNEDSIICYELMKLLFKYYKTDYVLLKDLTLTCMCSIMNRSSIYSETILNSPEINFVNELYYFMSKKILFSRELLHTSLQLIKNNKKYFDSRFNSLLITLFIDLDDAYLSSRAIEVLQNITSTDEILKIIPKNKPKLSIFKKNNSLIKEFMEKYYKC